MTNFTIHTTDTAPAASKPLLESVEKAYGFIPNILAIFAESPATLQAYLDLGALVEKTSFSKTEQKYLQLLVSAENSCEFCVAAHTTVLKGAKADEATIEALRKGSPAPDTKLEALFAFTRAVIAERGFVQGKALDDFLAAGYSKAQAMEVVLITAQKIITNYVNHFADTPLNDQFAANAWTASGRKAA